MTEFHLLIDDFRTYDMDHTARTAQEGRQALLSFPVTHLYMDHDLGEESDTDGYKVIVWALERGVCPAHVQMVTSNPVGRDNMIAALENADYTKEVTKTGIQYNKEIITNGDVTHNTQV